MIRHTRKLGLCFVLATALAVEGVAVGCGSKSWTDSVATTASIPRGGDLLVSMRADPSSFNRYVVRDTSSVLVATLTQAPSCGSIASRRRSSRGSRNDGLRRTTGER